MAASQRAGMGAIPFEDGVAFRVWAPFATSVCVAGRFNDWSVDATALTSEGDGYWSVDVAKASPGDQYKFIIANPALASALWKNDPYAKAMINSVGNSVVASTDYVWRSTHYNTPPWNEMAVYELHVGSFQFDPSSGSGRGVFRTIMAKLDYLADLGINAIQVMPADEFPGATSFGYNPADIFAIEDDYGGPNGFQALVDAAHLRGVAVIYDVVYNHLGPDDLDLWRFDGWSEDGGGGVYFYNDWRRATPWADTRPDYGRGEVRQFLRDNALYWLEEHRCDGLRFDATGWIRNVWGFNDDPGADLADGWSLMGWINSEVQARCPWKITIAEDMHDNAWITRALTQGGAGFSAQWGAGFMHNLRGAVVAPRDEDRDMNALAGFIRQRFNGGAFQRVLYTESHDEVAASNGGARLPEAIAHGAADGFFAQKRSTLAAAIVFTAPGIPMIFMGQEFLEWGAWSDAEQLDWSKAERFSGIRMLYRDLISLRRNLLGLTRGLCGPSLNVHHVNDADKVIAFHRWDSGGPRDDVVVMANFANRSYDSYRIGLPRAGVWRVRLNSDWGGYSPVFTSHSSFDLVAGEGSRDGMPFNGAVGIGPYAALILSQDG